MRKPFIGRTFQKSGNPGGWTGRNWEGGTQDCQGKVKGKNLVLKLWKRRSWKGQTKLERLTKDITLIQNLGPGGGG